MVYSFMCSKPCNIISFPLNIDFHLLGLLIFQAHELGKLRSVRWYKIKFTLIYQLKFLGQSMIEELVLESV